MCFRCARAGRWPAVCQVTVRGGVVTAAEGPLRECIGYRWHEVRPELAAARWTCEEVDADDLSGDA